ncbi:hypothetical protein MIR68_002212 [Amoeboaphelidium protococcarum]|nr:hypothetical protein MIR68_002212 [Amoeboaphelidium protococcarum]
MMNQTDILLFRTGAVNAFLTKHGITPDDDGFVDYKKLVPIIPLNGKLVSNQQFGTFLDNLRRSGVKEYGGKLGSDVYSSCGVKVEELRGTTHTLRSVHKLQLIPLCKAANCSLFEELGYSFVSNTLIAQSNTQSTSQPGEDSTEPFLGHHSSEVEILDDHEQVIQADVNEKCAASAEQCLIPEERSLQVKICQPPTNAEVSENLELRTYPVMDAMQQHDTLGLIRVLRNLQVSTDAFDDFTQAKFPVDATKVVGRFEVISFCRSLQLYQRSLKKVYLTGSSFNLEACLELANAFRELLQLEELWLCDCFKTQPSLLAQLSVLVASVTQQSNLKFLSVSRNALGASGAELVFGFLAELRSLQNLDCEDCGIPEEAIPRLCNLLSLARCKLQDLNLSLNKIRDGDFSLLNPLPNSLKSLSVVSFKGCSLSAPSMQSLLVALKQCSLKSVDLSDNFLAMSVDSPNGCHFVDAGEDLVAALAQWDHLKSLNLEDVSLNTTHAVPMIIELSKKSELQMIDLRYNDLEPAFSDALKQLLDSGSFAQVKEIALGGNDIESSSGLTQYQCINLRDDDDEDLEEVN